MRVNIGPYPKNEKIKRRINVRIDDYDTWNLDHTLGLIILPALKLIKKQKMGVPSDCFDYSHHSIKDWSSKEFKAAEKKANKEGFAKWDKILDDMIWSFTEIANNEKHEPNIKDDLAAFKAYEQRIQHGLDLFGKWYRGLWT